MRRGAPVATSGREQSIEVAQHRRLWVASTTLAVFICIFLLLGFASDPYAKRGTADNASASGYLLGGIPASQSDPLGLMGRIPYLELTGVSADGSVIGYTSELPVHLCASQLTATLVSDGWILYDDNGAGFLSFYHEEPGSVGNSALFVQLIAVGKESVIVINRW